MERCHVWLQNRLFSNSTKPYFKTARNSEMGFKAFNSLRFYNSANQFSNPIDDLFKLGRRIYWKVSFLA